MDGKGKMDEDRMQKEVRLKTEAETIMSYRLRLAGFCLQM